MFITKKALPRRTFLKGLGASLALPLLDSMVPALSAAPKPAPRLGFVYVPNGIIQEQWFPSATGPWSGDMPGILKPIAHLKEKFNVLGNLAHLQANTFGDGVGDHPRASAVWLSGVHAWDRTRPGMEVKLGVTADQIAARELGKETAIPSIELVLENPTQIACDTNDCFFVNTISWRSETTPNPTEAQPRIVFERLFGDGGNAQQRMKQVRSAGSILDSVMQETAGLQKSIGRGDQTKLNEYLDAIREVERSIQKTEAQGGQAIELPTRPTDVPATFDEHCKVMFDLMALAFRADITRVFTMIYARELSGRTYANIGVPEQHHAVSHHRLDPDLIARKAKIDTYHVSLLGYFLDKLAAIQDGDGSLLDKSMIMYGGGLGNGNLHEHNRLPVLMAGSMAGRFKTGRYIEYPENTPMANLLLTVLDKVGAHTPKLGDSTGLIQPDYLSL